MLEMRTSDQRAEHRTQRMKRLLDELRAECEARGETGWQTVVAAKIGVSRPMVSGIYKGTKGALRTIEKAKAAYGVTDDYFTAPLHDARSYHQFRAFKHRLAAASAAHGGVDAYFDAHPITSGSAGA